MNQPGKSLLLVGLLVVVIASACAGSRPASDRSGLPATSAAPIKPTIGAVQSSEAGSVTIEAQLVRAEGDSLVFKVSMDTHSVDLDQYDLKKLAIIRDDAGSEYRPVSWNSAPGGHHRQGVLAFPLPYSLSKGESKYVELVIRDVAGIKQRILKWEL